MTKRFVIFQLLIIIALLYAFSFSYAGEELIVSNEEPVFYLNKNVIIKYETDILKFYTSNKEEVFPITYNDSTYLPIRAISCLYNIPIVWDGVNNSILLNSAGQVDKNACEKVSNFEKNGLSTINADINKTIKIFYKNDIILFKDVNGVDIYPISYNNTTYLPLRTLCSLFNCDIDYDFKTNTVILGKVRDTASIQYDKNKSGDDIEGEFKNLLELINREFTFCDNSITVLRNDFYNASGDIDRLYYKKYLYEEDFGDSTSYTTIISDCDYTKVSGDINFKLAKFNDTLNCDIKLYKEDPVTGRNIFENEAEQKYKVIIEQSEGDSLTKELLLQDTNLKERYIDYYDYEDEYYFAIEGILILNGDGNARTIRAKEIMIDINDDFSRQYTLENSNRYQIIDVEYMQNDISKPIELKVKVLSTYSDSGDSISSDTIFSAIVPYVYSNIPQGR